MTEHAQELVAQPAIERAGEGDLLDVLEQRVEVLVGRYRIATSECDRQRRSVSERDRVIAELNSRIAELEKLRSEALTRVERLIDEVDRLERELDAESGA